MGGAGDGAAVTARDFGLEGPRGWAFRGVSIEAEPGALIAIEGPSGSGRSCLLLALTGRMRATEGTATVGGARLPKQSAAARRIGAPANVAGVTDLDPALTVGEHLHERALLQRRFGDSLRGLLRPRAERVAEERLRVDTALAAAGLDPTTLPKGSRTAVRDLERLEALRLSVALALIGRPRLLGVDDADLKLSAAERADVWALLRSIADAGTTVVAVCSEAPEGTTPVSTRPAATTARGPGTESGAVAESGAGTDPAPTPTTDADTGTDPGTDPGADPEATPGADPDADPQVDTDADPEAHPDAKKEAADALAETGRS
ncbi:ATP-binding cassette domain-containing protein [Streptomyces adustus]